MLDIKYIPSPPQVTSFSAQTAMAYANSCKDVSFAMVRAAIFLIEF